MQRGQHHRRTAPNGSRAELTGPSGTDPSRDGAPGPAATLPPVKETIDRRMWLVVAAFVATRLVLGFLANNPDVYGSSYAQVTTDVALYEGWAYDMVVQDKAPYSSFPMEYPPASVPFVAIPAADQTSVEDYEPGVYVPRFIALMLVVDVAGFAGLVVLARRWGSHFGLWVWIAGLFLLGPITYARLDLVPAVATIWALERASAASWGGAGAWLGFGAMAKVYPVFLAPIAFVMASARKKVVAGFALVTTLLLLPYVASLGDLYGSVVSFHAQRGVHVESVWGSLLMLGSKAGLDANVALSYGAFHVESPISGLLKTAASAAALGVVIFATRRSLRLSRDDAPAAAIAMFGTLALLLGVGSVFSPQFLIWLVAAGAAASCHRNDAFRSVVMLIFPLALATQILYPFIYHHVVDGNVYAMLFLACRNLLVAVAGIWAFASLSPAGREEPRPTRIPANAVAASPDG